MTQTTFFVCQSCHASDDRPQAQPADGTRLLEHLSTQRSDSSPSNPITIQSVGCLWTCDKPCAVACSASSKPTYLFTKLLADRDTAAALLEFGQRYFNSTTGDIPYKQFPDVLRQASIAKIPAIES